MAAIRLAPDAKRFNEAPAEKQGKTLSQAFLSRSAAKLQ